MSDVNDSVGPGEMVEALGQAWTLAHIGPGIRARFSAWCKMRARQAIAELRGTLGDDAYREDLGVFQEQLAAGAYSWGSPLDPDGAGPGVRAMLAGGDGKIQLLRLLLEPHHGDVPPGKVTELVNAAPTEVNLALAACLGTGVGVRGADRDEESGDPNVPGPVSTATGRTTAIRTTPPSTA